MKISEIIDLRIQIGKKQMIWQDLSLILLGAIILLLLAVFVEGIVFLQLLRIVLGLIYVLFIPGYCVTTALFPRSNDLNRVERVGLSIGFSIATVSLLVLLLDRMPWGLTFWPILLSEYGITGIFIVLTIWRHSQLCLEDIETISWTGHLRPWWDSLRVSERRAYKTLFVSIFMLSGLALCLFFLSGSRQSLTEFYILGKNGLIADYPYEVGAKDSVTVTVGVRNHENSDLDYHFEVWVTNGFHPENRIRVERSQVFLLQPGEKFEQPISWRMPWVGDDQKVELLLFYNHNSKPTRQLRMWINVKK